MFYIFISFIIFSIISLVIIEKESYYLCEDDRTYEWGKLFFLLNYLFYFSIIFASIYGLYNILYLSPVYY